MGFNSGKGCKCCSTSTTVSWGRHKVPLGNWYKEDSRRIIQVEQDQAGAGFALDLVCHCA